MSLHERRRTVLIADDDKAVLGLINEMLKVMGGFRVLSARDGVAALDISRGHEGVIDLLISDVDMPKMRGTALAAALCSERPGIKILLISGLPNVSIPPDSNWLFLPKPFSTDRLVEEVRRCCAYSLSAMYCFIQAIA